MTRPLDLVIRSRRVLTADGEAPRAVGVTGRTISVIDSFESPLDATRELVLEDDVVLMAGLVDPHVHVCEPGHTDWEGFETATRAAAAGGITTLVDMPLDSIPVTTDVQALERKREAAATKCHVDVGFWAGVVPNNLPSLDPLMRAGVLGFKCFLSESGLEEFPPVDASVLESALLALREAHYPLLVHAEDKEILLGAPEVNGPSYAGFLRSRPPEAEHRAIEIVVDAARRTGGWAHICHLSSAGSLPLLAQAQADGVRVTAEACPHHLALAAEDIPDGATTLKCCPPVRESSDREALWRGLEAGIIGFVVSDHSPCAPEMKHLRDGDFGLAWGGIASLQLSLPIVWTEARERGIGLAQVASWMGRQTAALAGLSRKGALATGCDADLVVFAPDEAFKVEAGMLLQRHKLTPYDGRKLYGVVRSTLLGGRQVGANEPMGRLLSHRDSHG